MPYIDILIIAEENGKMVYAGPIKNDTPFFYTSRIFRKEWFNLDVLDKLKLHKFENLMIPIPGDSDEWLKRVYGDDCYTRYVPDQRLSFIHKLPDLFDAYAIEQGLGYLLQDVLKLDQSTKNIDAHICNLISNTLGMSVQLIQNPTYLIKQVHTNNMLFINANLNHILSMVNLRL